MAERLSEIRDVKILSGEGEKRSIAEMQSAGVSCDTILELAHNAAALTHEQYPTLGPLPTLDEYRQMNWDHPEQAATWLVSLSEPQQQRAQRRSQELRDEHCMQGYDWMG